MTITAAQVKELRELTGAGMMDAKKALTDAEGDMEKAKEILRQKGVATAEKKSGRAAAEGLVEARIAADKKTGILVEVNCETDFVARGDAFKAMVDTVSAIVLDKAPADLEALMAMPSPQGGGTVQNYVTDQVGAIKENLTIRRFVRYERQGAGAVASYIHTGGKIGVLLEVAAQNDASTSKPEFQQLVKDLTLHIASASPEFVTRNEIPQSVIDEETRIEMGKEDLANKPVEIREKIVTGRVNKLMGERVLIEQPFVKDPSKTIEQLLADQSKALGDSFSVTRFTRFVLGEGIEKKQANFAEEVAAAVAGG